MFSSLRLQTSVVRLLTVIVCLAPVLLLSAPSLLNLNPTTSGEGGALILSADINNGGGGNMTLRVNWGDGPLDVYSYTNTATNFVVWHFYEDDNPTGTAADLYPVSLTLSNNTGLIATNLAVVVTNIPPRLELKVHSPIEIGAPATLRGLEITEFPLPPNSYPHGITVGPDKNIWFTEEGLNRIARITTNGVVTEFTIGGGTGGLWGIATGSDNRLWFCAAATGHIGAMTTNGAVTIYTIPRPPNEPLKTPQYIVPRGPSMWYTDRSYRIGRIITTSGSITQYVHEAGVNPWGLAVGADSNIWFAAYFTDTVNRLRLTAPVTTTSYALETLATPTMMTAGPDQAVWFAQLGAGTNVSGKIGRITTNGVLSEWSVGYTGPYGICAGPDGAIWFTESRRGTNSIGRITTNGHLSRYALALGSDVNHIVAGAEGALWFTLGERHRIGRIRYTTAGNVVLSGDLNDAGTLDSHLVTIDWGDGSALQTLNLTPGIASFHVAHIYSGARPFYLISVRAVDDDAGVSQSFALVEVNAIQITSVTRSPVGEVRVKGVGANGRTITMETSTDLQNWSTVGTVNSVSNQFEFVHPGAAGVRRFYRGKLP